MTSLALAATAASDNGRGRHKQIYVVPAPGPIVIDGRFGDWDLSGQIEMFVIEATRGTQSAKFALMYDDQALYVSGDVNDPSPMMNQHDPQVDPHKAWDADACQFRLTIDPAVGYPIRGESSFKYRGANAPADTRDDVVHMLLWHYTKEATANLQMHLGMAYRVPRPAWGPHGRVPPDAYQGAFLKRPDNTGYTFEYRIPWGTLGAKRPLKGGDIVAGTVQFNWSRPDGLQTAGGSAWAYDVMGGPGFVFQSTECWGKMIFSETGNVPREKVTEGVPPDRPLPLEFAYELPEDSQCTIQLFDATGRSVRILVPQQERLGGRNIERWDGTDAAGRLLPAGDYVWKGIRSAPIKALHRFSVHNSGRPAYPTDDNKGGWGGDHGTPQAVCALEDGLLLCWNSSEYGWGIIRTDIEGRKRWGSNHDATHLATDGTRIYIAGGHGFTASANVMLLDVSDSRPSRFATGIAAVAAPPGGTEADSQVTGLAWGGGKLYVSYAKRNLIGVFETVNGALQTTISVPSPGRLAVRPDGDLLVISAQSSVIHVRSASDHRSLITDHLDAPESIAVAPDGTTYVANRGQLQSVSVFGPDGAFLRRLGRAGGRPAVGRYDPSGIYEAGGIALDKLGRLWVAETTDGPKRISVWDTQSGANLKEFFGSSSYFGYGFIDPARPDEIYAHHTLWTIDWNRYTVQPTTTIWRQTAPNMAPAPLPDGYCAGRPLRIMTAANGRQYMWGKTREMALLLRRDSDLFRPFAAVLRVDTNGQASAGIQLAGDGAKPFPAGVYLWQDANDDQIVDPPELVPLPKGFERTEFAWLDKDLTLRLSTGHLLKPQQVTPAGQPRYDFASREATFLVDNPLGSGYLMQDDDGAVYVYAGRKGPSLIKWGADGQMAWHYDDIARWRDGLNLPIVQAGRLWGMTGSMGIAGDYFAHQTYFGINHIFRRDGMYVGAILKDGRVGGRGPYEGQPEGQGGQFVHLNLAGTNRYFVIHGGQDSRVWEVLGLDTVKDLPGGVYRHTDAMVARARDAQAAYAAALGASKQALVARGRPALEVAGAVGKQLEDGRGFEARLAYDAENLYVRFEVTAPCELVNGMTTPQTVFRGGNLLDIQLATDSAAAADRQTPAPGDLRLLVSRRKGKTFGVLFRPKVADFNGEPSVLSSPTGKESFDQIEELDNLILEYRKQATGFTATLTLPQAQLGLSLKPGAKLKLDLGYIFGNAEGTRTAVRAYVNNNSFTANVVDDIPHESRLEPANWGEATVE